MAYKEYIEREALLLKIDLHGTNKFGMLDEDIRAFVKDVPAADVVEVVRCKDCRLRDTEGCPFMFWDCGELMGETNDTDFCSYGKRKEQT